MSGWTMNTFFLPFVSIVIDFSLINVFCPSNDYLNFLQSKNLD